MTKINDIRRTASELSLSAFSGIPFGMADEQKPNLSEPTKTEIWREVEHRFKNPPADFVKLIEDEVEKRVVHRVKMYKLVAWIIVLSLIGFARLFWNASLSEVKTAVDNQLTNSVAIEAKNRLIAITTDAEHQNLILSNTTETLKSQQAVLQGNELALALEQKKAWQQALDNVRAWEDDRSKLDRVEADAQLVSNLTQSVVEDQKSVSNRLAQLNQQDNVVLSEDLPKLFVIQMVTNLVDGNRIVLDFSPVTQTVKIRIAPTRFLAPLSDGNNIGYLNGRTIILTNQNVLNQMSRLTNNQQIASVEYIRASKTK